MNFKPGDKAIYVGPVAPDYRHVIKSGDEVVLSHQPKHGIWEITTPDPLCGGGLWCKEKYLRKPDTYDITAQEWYQKILRGEKLEETA